ncbi:hypothetical protein [Sulfurimonas sp.]|uniref:hypothetical protein n=1 Tax=Sulfurimonas sp. TaxID=2022749 RepID=UPI0035662BAF
MTFNLDQLIHKNYEQTLKDYLNVNSLENYDIKIEELLPQNKSQFFNIYFNFTYNLSLLKNNLLAITATSKTYNNQIFSLTNQNHVKKLYSSNSIDFSTINSLETTNQEIESKRYSLSITEKNKRFNILLQIKKISTHILTTPFTEKYLIEYTLNKDIGTSHNELKNHLLNSYQEDKAIPYREDSEYKKIESFQPHELTYNVFYEMAIRNDQVKKVMHALNYLYDINSLHKNKINIDVIDCFIKNEEKIYTISGTVNLNDTTNYKIFIDVNGNRLQCVESIHDNIFEVEIFVDKKIDSLDLYVAIGSKTYQDDKINLGLPVANSTLMIRSTTTGVLEKNKETTISVKIDKVKSSISPNKDGSWLLDLNSSQKALTAEIILQKYHSFLKSEEHQIYFSTGIYVINELIEELETQLIEEYLIYPDNYDVNHPEKSDILLQRASKNAYDVQKLQNDASYIHENKYFFKEDEYDGYSVHQGISKGSDSRYNLSTIKQGSTKQVVDYNVSNFQINLNLPKHELISYLTKLKDNYDNDNSILMSPMELCGKELDIEPEDIRNMDSIKWADTFYIYDCYNNIDENITGKKSAIRTDLTEYHKDLEDEYNEDDVYISKELGTESMEDIRNSFLSEEKSNTKKHYMEIDTIGSRYKLMKALIEEEKYKSLI